MRTGRAWGGIASVLLPLTGCAADEQIHVSNITDRHGRVVAVDGGGVGAAGGFGGGEEVIDFPDSGLLIYPKVIYNVI